MQKVLPGSHQSSINIYKFTVVIQLLRKSIQYSLIDRLYTGWKSITTKSITHMSRHQSWQLIPDSSTAGYQDIPLQKKVFRNHTKSSNKKDRDRTGDSRSQDFPSDSRTQPSPSPGRSFTGENLYRTATLAQPTRYVWQSGGRCLGERGSRTASIYKNDECVITLFFLINIPPIKQNADIIKKK